MNKRTTLSVREDIAQVIRLEAVRNCETYAEMTDKLLAHALLNGLSKEPTPLVDGAGQLMIKVSSAELEAIS